MELFDERSSPNVFYKTLTGQEPEKVQSDSELGATDDQEIVDVILSGRVSTASLLFPFPFLSPDPPFSFQTEHHLHPAWELFGRVRISDGLVVLVRQPVRPQHALSPYLTLRGL
jgi:hypothetical protein